MSLVGHSSPAFCHEPVATTLEKVSRAGFDIWEVVGEGEHSPWDRRREFLKVLPSYSIRLQLHAPISDCNLGSLVPAAWEQSVQRVETALRGASVIGATRVTVHPGNHTPLSRDHYESLHEATRRAVRRLDRAGRELGLELNLENMPTGWAFETDSVRKLVDLVEGTEFGLCLDLGHAHVAKRLPEFQRAAKRVRNVHIHDNRGQVDEHRTLSEGNLPWKEAAGGLRRAGFGGPWIIESRSHASGRKSRALLRKHLASLDD